MTRPLASSQTFVASLPQEVAKRVMPVISPLLQIEERKGAIPLTDTDVAIFTSMYGVQFAPKGSGRTAYCVGPGTTQAAKKAGWKAVNAGGNADALVSTIKVQKPQGQLVHMSGHHTRGNVAARLNAAGLNAKTVTLYDQMQIPLTKKASDLLLGDLPVLIPLFSPRTAAQFVTVAPDTRNTVLVALSEAVAQEVDGFAPDRLYIAKEPNAKAMIATIADALMRI